MNPTRRQPISGLASAHLARLARLSVALLFLALVLLTAGCQSVNRLREAQDAFNQASTEDMQAAFGDGAPVSESIGTDAVARWAGVRNRYGIALVSLQRIDHKDEQVLRGEKLWGAKLTLEALCHWKLGQYDKALAIAREAQQTDQLFPRDRAVMQALPGLVMTDYAFDLRAKGVTARAAMNETTNPVSRATSGADLTNTVAKIEELTVKSGGAIDILQNARAGDLVEPTHPIHVYLIQAQLAAYRNFRRGFELLVQTGVPNSHPAHTNAQARLDDLAHRVSGPSGQSLVNKWAELDKLTPRSVGP